jgi:hypothetical protein
MGFREPRPGSPARLRVKAIATQYDEENGGIEVVVRMSYYAWCCDGTHELVDAGKAVERLFRKYDDATYILEEDPDEILWHEENVKEK